MEILKVPHQGYTNVEIVDNSGYKLIVEICGSGKEIEIYPDELE